MMKGTGHRLRYKSAADAQIAVSIIHTAVKLPQKPNDGPVDLVAAELTACGGLAENEHSKPAHPRGACAYQQDPSVGTWSDGLRIHRLPLFKLHRLLAHGRALTCESVRGEREQTVERV